MEEIGIDMKIEVRSSLICSDHRAGQQKPRLQQYLRCLVLPQI